MSSYLQQVQFNNAAVVSLRWGDFLAIVQSKSLPMQYVTNPDTTYTIFAMDGNIAYQCLLVPTSISGTWAFAPDYSETQNNTDVTTFTTVYQASANRPIGQIAPQQVVLSNATVTTGGSQIFSGFVNREINLFINVTAAPTGTSPGIQFTIQEIDPGNGTTPVGTSVTGLSITTGPTTQELTLNLTTSNTVEVSWIVVGTSPSFTGVYATLTTKPTTVFSGVDATGVERVFQPDSSGRLLVSGSNAVGSAVTYNPVVIGGVNPSGYAGYSQLASDDSLIMTDGPNTQPVMINATVTSNSISNLLNLGDGTVYLFINVKNAPTGTNPTLTFTLQELDPGDKATAIRSSITGVAIKAAGTQVLTLPNITSGVVEVSWTIGGTGTPTFTGVYATAICKSALSPDDELGNFYFSALNSTMFEASTASTGVAPGTAIGTTGAFTLYNPTTSTKNLVVQEINMSYISGTLGSGTVFLCSSANLSSAPTGTSITPICTNIGSSATAQGKAFTTSTLATTPTIIRGLWTLTPMLATSVFQPFVLEEITEGRYIIQPGSALSLEAVAGAGTSPKVVFSMSWVEVPF